MFDPEQWAVLQHIHSVRHHQVDVLDRGATAGAFHHDEDGGATPSDATCPSSSSSVACLPEAMSIARRASGKVSGFKPRYRVHHDVSNVLFEAVC